VVTDEPGTKFLTTDKIDISLVITNFNRARFLDRAIRSCLSQLILRRYIEIIVVDDYSTDDSSAVIGEFENEVRVFKNEKNLGVAASSNIALAEARGTYWMRVDADDFLNAHACAFMMSVLDENSETSYVYCDHFRVDQRGAKIEKIRLNNEQTLYEHGAGILFRTQALRDIGGYDESLRNCEDYDLLLRLKQSKYTGFYLPVPLYRYYIHGENITLSRDRDIFRKIVEAKHGV
jgi:glycosyltransferase involved in cell wall biosynthesis